jgi:hypothetical protein
VSVTVRCLLVTVAAIASDREAEDMTHTTPASERLRQAGSLAEILGAAYDAFEDLLAVIRRHQGRADGLFAAFVLAADALDAVSVTAVAQQLASLGQMLASRLARAASRAADPGDRAACCQAAWHAASIQALLSGGGGL